MSEAGAVGVIDERLETSQEGSLCGARAYWILRAEGALGPLGGVR